MRMCATRCMPALSGCLLLSHWHWERGGGRCSPFRVFPSSSGASSTRRRSCAEIFGGTRNIAKECVIDSFHIFGKRLLASPRCPDGGDALIESRLSNHWATTGDYPSKAFDPTPFLAGQKFCFLILNCLIFDSSVEGGIPSLTAAPFRPATFPLLSVRAASIISFS